MNDVRSEYRELSEAENNNLQSVKVAGQALIDCLRALGSSREASLAITKAEESVMWGVKHITK